MTGYIQLTEAEFLYGWTRTPDGKLAFFLSRGVYISVSENGVNIAIQEDNVDWARVSDIVDVLDDAGQIYMRL